jgi:hypothetical protein
MASRPELLEKLRRNRGDCLRADVVRLLKHHGFQLHEGAKHTMFTHELLPPGMVVTVPRHRRLKSWVARDAVAAVDLVEKGRATG